MFNPELHFYLWAYNLRRHSSEADSGLVSLAAKAEWFLNTVSLRTVPSWYMIYPDLEIID